MIILTVTGTHGKTMAFQPEEITSIQHSGAYFTIIKTTAGETYTVYEGVNKIKSAITKELQLTLFGG